MNPWIVAPVWQNYSSMYREAITAKEATTGMERSHHLTSSLYFAISALEAFLNQKMRKHLSKTHDEKQIYDRLRRGKITDKLKKWPDELLGKPLDLRPDTMGMISLFNDVRGDLTHPKTTGHQTYRTLEQVDPDSVIDVVAEYIAQYHHARGDQFHYWLWGWNYINPTQNQHEIMIINEQQFVHSMRALGFNVDSMSPSASEAFQKRFMSGYAGWRELADGLYELDRCEPKFVAFPYQPKLCRHWWTKEHHRTCGHVTREALDEAIALDKIYGEY